VYPLAEANSSWVFALIIFFGVFFTVVVGLMNLVLAVIVDFAVDARDEDAKMQAMLKEKMRKDARKKLMDLCEELDVDQGGSLTLEEFLRAMDGSPQFRAIMELLDVDKEDLECVFNIMDKDRSGEVSYSEFTDLLYKMKSQNSRTLLLFIKYYAVEIRHTVAEQLELVKSTVTSQLYKNTSMMEQMTFMMGGDIGGGSTAQPLGAVGGAPADLNGLESKWINLPGTVPLCVPESEEVEEVIVAEDRPASAASFQKSQPVVPKSGPGVATRTSIVPELDRIERFGLRLETELETLRREVMRKVDDRFEKMTSLMQKSNESQERFGDLMSRMREEQQNLIAGELRSQESGRLVTGTASNKSVASSTPGKRARMWKIEGARKRLLSRQKLAGVPQRDNSPGEVASPET